MPIAQKKDNDKIRDPKKINIYTTKIAHKTIKQQPKIAQLKKNNKKTKIRKTNGAKEEREVKINK